MLQELSDEEIAWLLDTVDSVEMLDDALEYVFEGYDNVDTMMSVAGEVYSTEEIRRHVKEKLERERDRRRGGA